MKPTVTIVGAGLAGAEAALQLAYRNIPVKLYEMRPKTPTEAHETAHAGEMVCSNSLGSVENHSASGLLKAELTLLGSRFLEFANRNRVPAGSSLSVDRIRLAADVDKALSEHPKIEFIREEVRQLPPEETPTIIASGPLTGSTLAEDLSRFTMRRHLFFFDATSPIIRADSINFKQVFRGSRYGKGTADFINIPLTETQYNEFVSELVKAESVSFRDFESKNLFEACLPVEEIARRGPLSLAFGPLKPVGLEDPDTGKLAFAVIQLRQDDIQENFYQIVGFQTRLKWGEQKRIFRTLPGLENAEFERFGRMHRNTYINAPLILSETGKAHNRPNLFFAGQISGVEGYVESICSGLLAGRYMMRLLSNQSLPPLPRETACGALFHYIAHAEWQNFKPTKFTFGLLPPMEFLRGQRKPPKKQRKELKARKALESMEKWIHQENF